MTKTTRNAPAYDLSAPAKLYTLVSKSLLNGDHFYRTNKTALGELSGLVKFCEPQFVANLAAYCRQEMHLRTTSVVLTTLLCRLHGGSIARKAVTRTVKRVDEITEMLTFFSEINHDNYREASQGHKAVKKLAKIPMSMKRGLADVFESGCFDAYQFSNYDSKGAITLKDALFRVNPKAKNDEQNKIFTAIANSKSNERREARGVEGTSNA